MDSLGTTSPQTCAAVVLVTESKVGVPGTCHGMEQTLGQRQNKWKSLGKNYNIDILYNHFLRRLAAVESQTIHLFWRV